MMMLGHDEHMAASWAGRRQSPDPITKNTDIGPGSDACGRVCELEPPSPHRPYGMAAFAGPGTKSRFLQAPRSAWC